MGSFQYDASGRRLGKTLNGTTTTVLHSGLDSAQEITGTTVRNILTGVGLDEYLSHASTSGETRFALTDALGSTIALVDPSGTLVTEYTYEPFGATSATGAPSENKSQYAGRENDGTGLYYYRARYYHPRLQRFISEDPLRFGGGDTNVYSYVWNSPVQFTDPLGLFPLGMLWNFGSLDLSGRKNSLPAVGGAPIVLANAAGAQAAQAALAAFAALAVLADQLGKMLRDLVISKNDTPKEGSDEVPKVPTIPEDPTQSPGSDWEWKGSSDKPEVGKGNWVNTKTGEKIYHDPYSKKHGPHIDYTDPQGREWRVYPNGRLEPKRD